eukprot:IDg9990t1
MQANINWQTDKEYFLRTPGDRHSTPHSTSLSAVGVKGISTDTKIEIALPQLCYEDCYDRVAGEFAVSNSTSADFLKRSCDAVVGCFASEYLQLPNEEEMKKISDMHAKLGFPGCLGALDCAS